MRIFKTFQYLALLLLLGGCSIAPSSSEDTNKFIFYVGSYTHGQSEGIYKYQLNENGSMQQVGLAAQTQNPTFLAISPDNKYLLAANEVDLSGQGQIESFQINPNGLKRLATSPTGGAHTCFIAVNEKGQVISANYTGGSMALHLLDEKGMLSKPLDVAQHVGKGSHWRQDAAHTHSAWFNPQQNEIIAVDLGTNQLYFYDLDDSSKTLKPATTQAQLAMAPGAGPRHLAVHPTRPLLYVLNELNATIALVTTNADGHKEIRQTVSSLPADFKGENLSAHILASADGRFLYVSNRGHNSIAIFAIDSQTGQLDLLDHVSTRGNTPRNFTLSPDGKFLLVANQDSNSIVAFMRDPNTGRLEYVSDIKAFMPSSLVFEKAL